MSLPGAQSRLSFPKSECIVYDRWFKNLRTTPIPYGREILLYFHAPAWNSIMTVCSLVQLSAIRQSISEPSVSIFVNAILSTCDSDFCKCTGGTLTVALQFIRRCDFIRRPLGHLPPVAEIDDMTLHLYGFTDMGACDGVRGTNPSNKCTRSALQLFK